jgi:hypothetical protein
MPLVSVDKAIDLLYSQPVTKTSGFAAQNRVQEAFQVTVGGVLPCLTHRGVPQVCCHGAKHKRISAHMIYCAGRESYCDSVLPFSLMHC